MSQAIATLLVLAVVLAVLAVVGHGIWLVAARVFRALSGDAQAATRRPTGHCPHCGRRLKVVQTGRCPSCHGLVGDPPRFTLEGDLAAIERQLHRLEQDGMISEAQKSEWLGIVRAQRDKLLQAESAPSTRRAEQAKPQAVVAAKPQATTAEKKAAPVAAQAVERPPELETPARPTPAPPPPKQPVADLLRAFMEEKNIRWGELVAGMLIVVSSVGLVISLWSTLEAIPYFPALLFMLVTAAIHQAGLYTYRQWNLRSTSRGLLVISTLLVPLNFLAGIALSEQRATGDPWYVAAVGVGLLAFGAITLSAGNVLLASRRWLLVIGVMGASAAQLVISRLGEPGLTTVQLTLLALPALCTFAVAAGANLWTLIHRPSMSERRAGRVFLLLATTLFAFIAAIGLLAWKTEAVRETLSALSPCLSLAAAVVLGTGLVAERKMSPAVSPGWKTTATWLALTGAALMLAALAFAWPRPHLLVATGVIDFVLLSYLAGVGRLPVLHHSAVAALALSSVVGFHLLRGAIGWDASGRQLVEVILLGRSGVILGLLSIVTTATAWLFHRSNNTAESRCYCWNTAGLGTAATLIAVYSGFWAGTGVDRDLATAIFLFYAVYTLMVAAWRRTAWISWLGSALLLTALAHGLNWNPWLQSLLARWQLLPERPLLIAALWHGTLTGLLALVIDVFVRRRYAENIASEFQSGFSLPLGQSVLIPTVVALPAILRVEGTLFAEHAGYAVWAAAIWLGVAVLLQSRVWFTSGQVLATMGLGFAVTAFCRTQDWWADTYFDPRYLQFQLGMLAVWALLWSVARRLRTPFRDLLDWETSAFDELLLGLAVAGVFGLSLAGCLPGVAAELGSATLAPQFSPPMLLALAVVTALAVGLLLAVSKTVALSNSAAVFFVGLIGVIVVTAAAGVFDGRIMASLFGVSHVHAYGWGSWIVAGLVLIGLCVASRERLSPPVLSGIVLTTIAVPLLIAGPFERVSAAATALRWGLAVHVLLTAMLLCGRDRIAALAGRCGWPVASTNATDTVRLLALGLCGVPIVGLTLRYTWIVLLGGTTVAPTTGSLFANLTPAASYAVPLGVLALALNLMAVRDRLPVLALGGSMLVQFAVSLAYILRQPGVPIADYADFVELLSWNALALGMYALLWQALLRWLPRSSERQDAPVVLTTVPLDIQVLLMQGVTAVLAVWATAAIVLSPGALPDALQPLGKLPARLAVVLAAGVSLWHYRRWCPVAAVHVAGAFGLAVVPMVAQATAATNSPQNWLAYHVLMLGWLALAGLATFAACGSPLLRLRSSSDDREDSLAVSPVGWAKLFIGLVVLLAVRALFGDPARPWWSVWTTAAAAGFTFGLALRDRSQRLAYASTLLTVLAATFGALEPWFIPSIPVTIQSWVVLIQIALIALASAGFVWLVVTVWWQRVHGEVFDVAIRSLPVEHTAPVSALILAAALSVVCITVRTILGGDSPDVSNPEGWLLLAVLGVALFTTLWHRTARHALASLYVWGLVLLTVVLDALQLSPRNLVFGVACAASGYVLLTSWLWFSRETLTTVARRLRMEQSTVSTERTIDWLMPVNLLWTGAVTVIVFWVVSTFDLFSHRLIATGTAALLAPAAALLMHERRRELLQILTLILAGVAAVDLGWAIMPVDVGETFWLLRSIRLLAVLSVVTIVYSVVLLRMLPPAGLWFAAARRAAIVFGGAALVSLVAVLLLELRFYVPGEGAPVPKPQMFVVATVLIGLAGALLSLAVLPGRDPLNLSERGRMIYVYAAELVVLLLVVHKRLTLPGLFEVLRPYWPMVIMGIAFCGIGAAEWFRRKGLRVLSEPLERTGAFLPLIPALGFWAVGSETEYYNVLFVAGLVYVVASMWRPSFVYSLAAALAGNAGLWALWADQQLSLLERPQLWLIPPALSVLAAAQLNRQRLGEEQLTAIRYLAVTVIYVSSAGEMFITGVAESLLLPIVLASLSVAGVLAGIMLRVRAFLYLGSSFLLLSLVSMVSHAAQNIGHVWPWWTFGIATGLAILALFGVFEKKRNETLRMFEGLRQWER